MAGGIEEARQAAIKNMQPGAEDDWYRKAAELHEKLYEAEQKIERLENFIELLWETFKLKHGALRRIQEAGVCEHSEAGACNVCATKEE